EYRSTQAPPDSDRDGMPDEWETARGLNPKDAADAAGPAVGGYTNVEAYLNSLTPARPAAETVKRVPGRGR
ncbi:MAG: pectate lyase, partial [Bryobacteraceae bacterium]|nr:pectate lyase [Bryobacteraceae bacterium]